jgi:hypothetical protein
METMRTLIFLFTALTLSAIGQTGPGKSNTENEHVSVSITLKSDTFTPGDSGLIMINFKSDENYYINMEPIPTVKLDSNKIIASVGKVLLNKSKKPEYADISKPAKVPFTLSKAIRKGKYEIKGTLTYFFCSGTEGWCSKFKQSFSINLTVK